MNSALKTLFAAAALASAHPALASPQSPLKCTAESGVVLTLEQNDASEVEATLESAQGSKLLHGTAHLKSHSFFATVYSYELTDAAGAKFSVDVSHHVQVGRGGCGRAGCPSDGAGSLASIDAVLASADLNLSLSCVELP